MSYRVDLLSNATATGTAHVWPGGMGSFIATGTWNGATVTLQVLGPNGSTYIPVGAETTLTADGGANFMLPPGTIRALVAGGPPAAMFAVAVRQLP